jgi:hypothetical protein
MLEQMVSPVSWKRRGGQGTIALEDSALVVQQTPCVHFEIFVFCEKLRRARKLAPRGANHVETTALTPARALLEEKLQRPLTFNFIELTPLMEIVNYLERAIDVTILVHWRSLAAQNLTPDARVVCVVENQPAERALDALLQPLALSWIAVDRRTIQIVTHAEAEKRYELEFYPIGALGSNQGNSAELIARLRHATGDRLWTDSGEGVAWYDVPSSYLLVRQTQLVQEQVRKWLATVDAPSRPQATNVGGSIRDPQTLRNTRAPYRP